MTKKLSIATLFLAFLGFLDATYLTIVHYKNLTVPCSVAHGCETVLTSKFATIGPIPISLIGAGFYIGVLILTALLLQNTHQFSFGNWKLKIENLLLLLTGSGLLVGVFLVYLQAFVLHAYCQYCLGSEIIDLFLFVCAWLLYKQNKPSTQE